MPCALHHSHFTTPAASPSSNPNCSPTSNTNMNEQPTPLLPPPDANEAMVSGLLKLTDKAAQSILELQIAAVESRDPGIIKLIERELTFLQDTSRAAGTHVSDHYAAMARRQGPSQDA